MSLFKPVLVENKTSLDSVTKVNGQYIIVVDTKEIYVDRLAADGTVERIGVNRGNVFLQSNAPENPVEGDIWLQTEGGTISYTDPFSGAVTTFTVPRDDMTWEEFVNSEYNTNSFFYLEESIGMNVWVSQYKLLIALTFPDGSSLGRAVLSTDIIVPGSIIS